MEQVVTLILAAGASRRMGEIKALLPWGPKTIIGHLVAEVRASGPGEILIVSGAYQEELMAEIASLPVSILHNPDWEAGMGSSLASGVREVEERFPQADALLVMLVDQPLVSGRFLQRIRQEHLEFPDLIIASDYGAFAGVPALFPRPFWHALKGLEGDRGAKRLIASRRSECRVLDPGLAITDIDTPQAYSKALRKAGITPKNQ